MAYLGPRSHDVSQGCNHLKIQPREDIPNVLTWLLVAFRLWWIVELKSNLVSDISSLLPDSICYMHVTRYIRVWGLHKDVLDTRQQKTLGHFRACHPSPLFLSWMRCYGRGTRWRIPP